MRAIRYKYRAIRYKYIVLILLLLLAAFGVFRWWQGPQVTGYTLEPMPLVQSVVATGQSNHRFTCSSW